MDYPVMQNELEEMQMQVAADGGVDTSDSDENVTCECDKEET